MEGRGRGAIAARARAVVRARARAVARRRVRWHRCGCGGPHGWAARWPGHIAAADCLGTLHRTLHRARLVAARGRGMSRAAMAGDVGAGACGPRGRPRGGGGKEEAGEVARGEAEEEAGGEARAAMRSSQAVSPSKRRAVATYLWRCGGGTCMHGAVWTSCGCMSGEGMAWRCGDSGAHIGAWCCT